jgi:hypothetical protein
MSHKGTASSPVAAGVEWLGFSEQIDLEEWLSGADSTAPNTSNIAAGDVAFQRWYRFKEAFSPSFVSEALKSLRSRPRTCVDPFAGSGTTAVTCQFLGVYPIAIEVNPFLADLTEAKLAHYDSRRLVADYAAVCIAVRELRTRRAARHRTAVVDEMPQTFVEPGVNGRWVFDISVAERIAGYRNAIELVRSPENKRLLRVLLGSVLVSVSNVLISGKGRRYRRPSAQHRARPEDVDKQLDQAFERAVFDIARFGAKAKCGYSVLRGDARIRMREVEAADVILCSPPYPNSFDYTDIYNLELWGAGYLRARRDNRSLREATLRSHVQIHRAYETGLLTSPLLDDTLDALHEASSRLWNRNIPRMVGAYFDDLLTILRVAPGMLHSDGAVLMVVGDSRYANVRIDVAGILSELAPSIGLRCDKCSPVRVMRASAQQGGKADLTESLLRFAVA